MRTAVSGRSSARRQHRGDERRLNRAGVAFLYSRQIPNRAAEVGPHPSHLLSIGTFVDAARLRSPPSTSASRHSSVTKTISISSISFHRGQGDEHAGAAGRQSALLDTQLIADSVRIAGYDGVTFRSSVAGGQNLCVFSPDGLRYLDGSATVLEVTKVKYSTVAAPVVDARNADDYSPLDN